VPCLFAADELSALRDLKPERPAPEEPSYISASRALKVYDAMNEAITKLLKETSASAGVEDNSAPDTSRFILDFADIFFRKIPSPAQLQGKTTIEAYSELSNVARSVADTLTTSTNYDYFGSRTKTGNAQGAAQKALSQVQNDILTAVRNASTEALVIKPPQQYEPPTDISCSVSVLPWQETSDTFGRRVANQFLAIQVTVRNLNTKNEFLMHDIQVAVDTGLSTDGYFWKQYAGRFQAGRDKLLVRSVAQRGQTEDRRNLVLNSLVTIGAIAGSAAIAGSTDFKTGVAVFQGAFIPGFSTIFPDHTVEQLNHINDLVFSASNTSKVLVPIQGSVPLVTFIPAKPIEQLPFAWCGYVQHYWAKSKPSSHPCVYDPYTWRDEGFPHQSFLHDVGGLPDVEALGKGWKGRSFRDWQPAALRVLQNHVFVVIGGVHIQQLTNAPSKVASLDCPTLPGGAIDIAQSKDGVITCNVTGNGLDKVSSVSIEKGTEKIAGKVKPAKDGNSATLEFDPSALSDANGIYSLYLMTNSTNGSVQETDSGEKISLSLQTFVSSIDPQLDLSQGSIVPLTLTGKHLDLIVHLYLVPTDGAAVESSGKFSAAKNSSIDKGLTAEFATSGATGLVTGKTYYLRYTVKDQLGKQIDLKSLTVKSVTQAPAAAPAITKLSVVSGKMGTPVTITGTNFGAAQGSSIVAFSGTPGTPTKWDATNIEVPVPAGAQTGNVVVTVGGVASKGVKFTVAAVPVITKLSATSGKVGSPITITGTNFGNAQGSSTVTFGGTQGTPTKWDATSIEVPVPSGAKTGNVVVTVAGVASKGVRLTIP
jgi:IPT/TIG domain